MHELVRNAQQLQERVQDMYQEVYDFISSTEGNLKKMDLNLADLADMGFLCREMENFLDNARKEVKGRKELCGKIIGLAVAKQSLADPSKLKTNVKGELATATPDVKQEPKLPSKRLPDGTPNPEFHSLLMAMGFSEELAKSGLVDLRWKGMCDWISERTALGLPLPKEIVATYSAPTATFRRRKRTGN